MGSRHLKTLYARHDEINVYEDTGIGVSYSIYIGKKYYTKRSSLKEAMAIAEHLSDTR